MNTTVIRRTLADRSTVYDVQIDLHNGGQRVTIYAESEYSARRIAEEIVDGAVDIDFGATPMRPTATQERAEILTRAMAGDRLLIVSVETTYGIERIYPVNPAAHALAQFAGTKTLSRANLALARDVLGLEIAEDPRPRLALVAASTVQS